jgi:hypothetical protein
MNISDFENTSVYRSLIVRNFNLSEDEAFSLLTCLLDLEGKQSVEIMEWDLLIREHCRFEDIRGGMYFAISKFINEQQLIEKREISGLKALIKLSESGQALLDQIRLEVFIKQRNDTNIQFSF